METYHFQKILNDTPNPYLNPNIGYNPFVINECDNVLSLGKICNTTFLAKPLSLNNIGIGLKDSGFYSAEYLNPLDMDCISNLLSTPPRWTIDALQNKTYQVKEYIEPTLSLLSSLEHKTVKLAKEYEIPRITSVSSQVSTITGLLSTQDDVIKEIIAPSSLMDDIKYLAINTHKIFAETQKTTEWHLGVIDSASYFINEYISWSSKLCKSLYSEPKAYEEVLKPKLNIIKSLPQELEIEKEKNPDISAQEAFEISSLHRLCEKGKRLINKIVDVNKLCAMQQSPLLFKNTIESMNSIAMICGTCCSSKNALGDIVDSLYKIFYENISRIKKYVSDKALREEDVYQCVFRLKDIRTDYRHDYDHGNDNKIRKKIRDIQTAYRHYVGKSLPKTREDFQNVQGKLYDEFETLVDHLYILIENYEAENQ